MTTTTGKNRDSKELGCNKRWVVSSSRKLVLHRELVTTENCSVFVPMPQIFSYDLDGNLLQDGLWNYKRDADGARQRGDGAPKARPKGCPSRVPPGRTRQQNRLKRMETASLAYTAGAPRKRVDYAYDERGRRTLKSVYTWNTSTSAFNTTPAAKVGFLYHDWNLLQKVDLSGSSPATLRSYYWGLDMSGTFQGAGGVGGLLAADLDATTYSTAFYASDANGNVSDLAWCQGGFAAHYEYDAFGNAFPENTGWINLAGLNPFRFSTKYTETDAALGGNETGLLYYGFRYYSPSTGRWPNRDPLEDAELLEGPNLYRYTANDPIDWIDSDGRMVMAPAAARWSGAQVAGAAVAAWLAWDAMQQESLTRQALEETLRRIEEHRNSCPVRAETLDSKSQHERPDSGLAGLSDAEVSARARDRSLSGEERRRYQKEEKIRGQRNKQKRKSN